MKNLPLPAPAFTHRKQKILDQLSVPDAAYTDASPKGSVDAGIRQLIDQVNAHAGLVTTSSCAGRVSVYLEGAKAAAAAAAMGTPAAGGSASLVGAGTGTGTGRATATATAGARGGVASSAGGKGGGEWLFVSHDPVEMGCGCGDGDGSEEGYERLLLGLKAVEGAAEPNRGELAGLTASLRLIHFKFEPMILHVLAASLEHAQLVIQAGMEAGFRETGAVSLLKRQPDEEAMPVVAVRSMGLSFESLIGAETRGVRRLIVTPEYLKTLVQIANERFVENKKRIARFSAALEVAVSPPKSKDGWEDAQARRERKRQEGLRRREELRKDSKSADESSVDLTLQQSDME